PIAGPTCITRNDERDDLAFAFGRYVACEAHARIAECARDGDRDVFISPRIEVVDGFDQDGRAECLVFPIEAEAAGEDLERLPKDSETTFFKRDRSADTKLLTN